MQFIICENADVSWWKIYKCLEDIEDYSMNLIEDLMPPAPMLCKQCGKKSVQSDMREFNLLEDVSTIAQIWHHQIPVLSVFCLFRSYVKFADTKVTKAADLVNHMVTWSTQGGCPSSGITSVLV